MAEQQNQIYIVGDYRIDTRRGLLLRGLTELKIERKVFELLVYFVQHAGVLISRNDLLDTLWPNREVGDNALNVAVTKCRRALGQKRGGLQYIENIHSQGYRFVAPVRIVNADGYSRTSISKDSLVAPAKSQERVSASSQSLFVGRAQVMDELHESLNRVSKGLGQISILMGDPGIGKTRIAEMLDAHATRQGIPVHWGYCRKDDSTPPLWPWIQIIRGCIKNNSREDIENILGERLFDFVRLVPENGDSREKTAVIEPSNHEAARLRAFEAVRFLLTGLAERHPILLIIDDLQWSDGPSLALLEHLNDHLDNIGVMIVVAARNTETDQRSSIGKNLDNLLEHPKCHKIAIGPLNMEEVEEYTAALLGTATPTLCKTVYEKSEGSPFLMTELLRPVAVKGSDPTEIKDISLPISALEIIRHRIRNLSIKAREVLSAASVLGRTFDLVLLRRITELDMAELNQAIEEARQARVIRPAPDEDASYVFSHVLFRDVLLDELSLSEQSKWHLALALALEQSENIAPSELAYHFYAAMPHDYGELTIKYCVEAAETATRLFAYEEACQYYRQAIEALDYDPLKMEPIERCHILLALGKSLHIAARYDDALIVFEQVVALARPAKRFRELAIAAIGIRDCRRPAWTEPVPRAVKLLNEALENLPQEEITLRAGILARLAREPNIESRREFAKQAANIARMTTNPETQYNVLVARLYATQGAESVSESEGFIDEILQLADKHRSPLWKWEAFLARYENRLRVGDMAGLQKTLHAMANEAHSSGYKLFQAEAERLELSQRICNGYFDQAEDELVRLHKQYERLQTFRYYDVLVRWLKAYIYAYSGNMEESLREINFIFAEYPWTDNPFQMPQVAWIYLWAGDETRARKTYNHFAELNFKNLPIITKPYAAFNIARLCYVFQDRKGAPLLYRILSPYAEQNAVTTTSTSLGSISVAMGELALLMGKTEQAEDHFRRAIEMDRSMGNMVALSISLLSYGNFCLKKDHVKSAELLNEGVSIAQRLGFKTVLEVGEIYRSLTD